MDLTGRVQVQYNTTSVDDDDLGPGPGPRVASSTFETRRVRLGARVSVEEWITGMAEVELALGNLAMRNVFMNLAFSDGFQLRMGQF
ncbi:MAG TPA: hypothetical protein VMP86_00035, partial [Candidatus Binatia bacterium]|nr:hypothetical protein [Candidatus Binatia bacterium]